MNDNLLSNDFTQSIRKSISEESLILDAINSLKEYGLTNRDRQSFPLLIIGCHIKQLSYNIIILRNVFKH